MLHATVEDILFVATEGGFRAMYHINTLRALSHCGFFYIRVFRWKWRCLSSTEC